jgi:hypothetical protein
LQGLGGVETKMSLVLELQAAKSFRSFTKKKPFYWVDIEIKQTTSYKGTFLKESSWFKDYF